MRAEKFLLGSRDEMRQPGVIVAPGGTRPSAAVNLPPGSSHDICGSRPVRNRSRHQPTPLAGAGLPVALARRRGSGICRPFTPPRLDGTRDAASRGDAQLGQQPLSQSHVADNEKNDPCPVWQIDSSLTDVSAMEITANELRLHASTRVAPEVAAVNVRVTFRAALVACQ